VQKEYIRDSACIAVWCKICARRDAEVYTVRAIGPDGPSDVTGRGPDAG